MPSAAIIGEQDIHDIIDHRLIPSGYPGASTDKYFVDGLPEVVVRHTPGEPEPAQIERTAVAYNALPSHGIPALPYNSVSHDGDVYVVTRKLHGVELDDLLHENANPELIAEVDQNWANITNYLASGRINSHNCATDITGPCQYMYGKTVADRTEGLTLVDLGTAARNWAVWPHEPEFDRELLGMAHSLMGMEITLDRALPLARSALTQAIEVAIELGDPSDDYRQQVIETTKRLLRDRAIITEDEEDLL